MSVPDQIQQAAEWVSTSLSGFHTEQHYQRALALELKARGFVLNCEVMAPCWFSDSTGQLHAISNDRIDIHISAPEACIIEIKKGLRKIDDAASQLERYRHSLKMSGAPVKWALAIAFGPDSFLLKLHV